MELRERPLRAAAVTVEYDPGRRLVRPRPIRNGRPFRPYVRGAARPAWMLRALARARAEHGDPVMRRGRDGNYTAGG